MTIKREYFRSIIFGIEDSLVSTTGLIAGLSVGSESKKIVILGGMLAIIVEAVSMGAGEYISDDAVQEMDGRKNKPDSAARSGGLMFISYFTAGLIPLWPFLAFAQPFLAFAQPLSLMVSITSALIFLFLLGFIKGKYLHTSPMRGGIKILIVGGLATILGVIVGLIFKV